MYTQDTPCGWNTERVHEDGPTEPQEWGLEVEGRRRGWEKAQRQEEASLVWLAWGYLWEAICEAKFLISKKKKIPYSGGYK